MKLLRLSAALCLTLALSACALRADSPAFAGTDLTKPHMTLQVSYSTDTKYAPSFVIWVVNPSTGENTTLYVTRKAGGWAWSETNPRPEALPVWNGLVAHERDSLSLDAITSPTPKNGAPLVLPLPESITDDYFAICIEANASYDYNRYYAQTNDGDHSIDTGVNGQPSMIYRVRINRATGEVSKPELVGSGDPTGATDELTPPLSAVSSAKNIITGVTVACSNGDAQ